MTPVVEALTLLILLKCINHSFPPLIASWFSMSVHTLDELHDAFCGRSDNDPGLAVVQRPNQTSSAIAGTQIIDRGWLALKIGQRREKPDAS